MCEAAVAWALYLQTVASFERMAGNPYLADLGRLRKKIRSKLPAALLPSPSPCGVIGIEPETSTLYFPCSCSVQF